MTPKQKENHVQSIKDLLTSKGWVGDRWGHYKIDDYRIKMQKTSLRYEKKVGGTWVNLISDYYVNIVLDNDRLVIKGKRVGV